MISLEKIVTVVQNAGSDFFRSPQKRTSHWYRRVTMAIYGWSISRVWKRASSYRASLRRAGESGNTLALALRLIEMPARSVIRSGRGENRIRFSQLMFPYNWPQRLLDGHAISAYAPLPLLRGGPTYESPVGGDAACWMRSGRLLLPPGGWRYSPLAGRPGGLDEMAGNKLAHGDSRTLTGP